MRRYILSFVATAALAACCQSSTQASDYCGPSSTPDVFYNMFVGPVPCGPYGPTGAQLYVSPRPTPPLVGHTFNPYPPLLPHEFLYAHKRTYWRDHGPHGGVTRTDVHYGTWPLKFRKCKDCGYTPFASPAGEYTGW